MKTRAVLLSRPGHARRWPAPVLCGGQALAEALLAMLALLSLWVGAAWLARYQDIALQASHASRFAAFAVTRHADARPLDDIHRHFFSGPGHRWADRRGRQILQPGRPEVRLHVDRHAHLGPQAQPGALNSQALALRPQWQIEDAGIVTAAVAVSARGGTDASHAASFMSGLRDFDLAYPRLSRHTAILAGAGHAGGDVQAQQRVASAPQAWREAAQASQSAGRQAAPVMGRVDHGWGRPPPDFDWLAPWTGAVPPQHLSSYGDMP